MKYRRPECSVLGDAARVIQIISTKDFSAAEFDVIVGTWDFNPAYDLDE